MSSNQIGGFFNRLEASRKYLFASVGVLGTSGASVISGTLILRGQEVQPVVEAAPDWESYSYVKLDLKGNEEDKKFFEAALAWDLEIDGKKWADGKNVSWSHCFIDWNVFGWLLGILVQVNFIMKEFIKPNSFILVFLPRYLFFFDTFQVLRLHV